MTDAADHPFTVLVTGGSRGIGRAIALRLARPGGRVVINYLRNEDAAEATATEVRERGAEAVVVQANVRSEKDLKVLAAAAGPVDVLVHNAAVEAMKPFDKMRVITYGVQLSFQNNSRVLLEAWLGGPLEHAA